METAAFSAISRFGFGRRANQPLPANPRQWLADQLTGADTANTTGQVDTPAALAVVGGVLSMRREAKLAGKPDEKPEMANHPVQDLARQEIHALLSQALMTDASYRERLVWFWANHFTIANKALATSACCGTYIREAIRPHVTGRFADMLQAVMHHPAMLNYLNQEHSSGPNSLAGLRRHQGLNENLARESLELHTVSPASGYTQSDVTNYAKILTGWSFEVREAPLGFRFRQQMHEPGEIEVMGRTWPGGEDGGIAILNWLGTHPATYTHIATKLVRHFVADDPAPSDVVRISGVLSDTQGDLASAALALTELPDAWRPQQKLRNPQEYVIAALRAIGATPDSVPNLQGMCASLGQPVFQAPFPIGWPDRAPDWAGPEAMLQRVDFAYGLSARIANTDPVQLGHDTLGPLLSADTLGQIHAAGSRRDGLTLLLSSPEFMRR